MLTPRLIDNIKRNMTCADYYNSYIDPKVNLHEQPKQCCPFHEEDSPSFSYMSMKDRWRCFGACGIGGDVIDMHRVNKRIDSYEEAGLNLAAILGIDTIQIDFNPTAYKRDVNLGKAELLVLLQQLEVLASGDIERYLEIDTQVSFYELPSDKLLRMRELLHEWKH